MSVYKDSKTGKWYTIYRIRDVKGKQKQIRKAGFETRELAYQYECSMIITNKNIIKERIKFNSLYLAYISYCKTNRAANTIAGYNYCYNKYLKVFGDRYINQITLKDIENYRLQLESDPDVSIYRINVVFKLMSRILEFGVKYSYLSNNVCSHLESLKNYSVKQIAVDFYTVDEFKEFISYLPSDKNNKDYIFYVVFNLLYYTGLRSGELLALDYTDVQLDKSIIKVNKSLARGKKGKYVIKTTKTDSSINNVYIPNTLLKILKEYLESINFKKSSALFQYNNRRLSKRTLDNKKNYYCDLSGLRRIRLHDFRHSFASLIYELSNYNLSEVAKRLRHSNISTVMKTYIHVFPNRRNEVDNKLDNI